MSGGKKERRKVERRIKFKREQGEGDERLGGQEKKRYKRRTEKIV